MALLEVRKLWVSYGGVRALKGISLEVEEGEVVAVVGPNGSGKTTLLRATAGVTPHSGGSICFASREVTALPAYRRARLGLIYTPERGRVAPELTVLENLRVGALLRRDPASARATLEEIFALFPCLAQKKHYPAGALSGGEKQMLLIGRALVARPRMLLLDEPFFGLSTGMKQVLSQVIRTLPPRGVTVLFSEHDLKAATSLAGRIYGFCQGRIIFAGSSTEFLQTNAAQRIYA